MDDFSIKVAHKKNKKALMHFYKKIMKIAKQFKEEMRKKKKIQSKAKRKQSMEEEQIPQYLQCLNWLRVMVNELSANNQLTIAVDHENVSNV